MDLQCKYVLQAVAKWPFYLTHQNQYWSILIFSAYIYFFHPFISYSYFLLSLNRFQSVLPSFCLFHKKIAIATPNKNGMAGKILTSIFVP